MKKKIMALALASTMILSTAGIAAYANTDASLNVAAVEVTTPTSADALKAQTSKMAEKLVSLSASDRLKAYKIFKQYVQTDKGINSLKTAINSEDTTGIMAPFVNALGDYKDYKAELNLMLDMLKAFPTAERTAIISKIDSKSELNMTADQKTAMENIYSAFVGKNAAQKLNDEHAISGAVIANTLTALAGNVTLKDGEGAAFAVESVDSSFAEKLTAAIKGYTIDGKTFTSAEDYIKYIVDRINAVIDDDMKNDAKAVLKAAGVFTADDKDDDDKKDDKITTDTKLETGTAATSKKVSTVIKNNTTENAGFVVIFAAYKGDKFVTAKVVNKTLAAGAEETVAQEFESDKVDSVKVMVWDSLTNATPKTSSDSVKLN